MHQKCLLDLIAILFMNSLKLWFPVQDLKMTWPVNILSQMGDGPMRPHLSPRDYWQLNIVGEESAVFFSGEPTDKLSLLK